ncbi:MAG TPA: hypothetical protein VGR35_05740 [Tepidisphaeraceae bacterium]|nr:hypothetical protein [Tepidisphaeraceae bacterium]
MAFHIELSPDTQDHLAELRRFEQQKITGAIAAQLKTDPLKQTRNRKAMRSNLIATRELRIGDSGVL